ncbi:MAG: STM3941 family protein [Bacteroidota bacterium]
MNQVEIPISKNKLALRILVSFLFLGVGVWLTFSELNITLLRIIGILVIIFFGAVLVFMILKFFDDRMGLILNKNGLIDNSSGTSMGLIRWNDIIEVKMEQVKSTKFLLIFIKNPEEYIGRGKSLSISKYQLLKLNNKTYGTPICISANFLECDFIELKNMIIKHLKKYGTR